MFFNDLRIGDRFRFSGDLYVMQKISDDYYRDGKHSAVPIGLGVEIPVEKTADSMPWDDREKVVNYASVPAYESTASNVATWLFDNRGNTISFMAGVLVGGFVFGVLFAR